nr:SpaA isopeptide-forming pilin-related protein [Paenibacillus roseus]
MQKSLARSSEQSLLTNVILRDANGNIIDSEANPDNRPKRGDALTIEYEWKLENGHHYKAGDQFTFQLPEAFELYNELDGALGQYGTYEVSVDGTVVFTFNSSVETNSNISGTFKVETKFSEQTITGSTKQQLEFPLKDGLKTIPIHFQKEIGAEIEKSGLPNKPLNPSQINWTIAFNQGERVIENAVLSEQLPAGLELAEGTVKLFGLTINLDGTSQKGDLIEEDLYEVVPKPDGSFEIQFKEPISEAYTLEFATNITNEGQTNFTNKAILKGSSMPDLESTSTVDIGYGKALDKSALVYSATDQTIMWSVRYNFNEKFISKENAVLNDIFNGSQELVNGSVKLYPITFDQDGNPVRGAAVPDTEYTLDSSVPGGFAFRFHDDVTSAYELVYQTVIHDRVYQNGTVNNTVSWDGIDASFDQPTSQVVLNKRNVSADYAAKTTDWEIYVNGNHFPMENPVITDSFVNSRLELLPGSVTIVDGSGLTLALNQDYTLEPTNSYREGFVIRFLKSSTESYTIRYTTRFDPVVGNSHQYLNKAKLDWKENNVQMPTIEAEATFEQDTYTKANGFKKGSYNAKTKEITWTLGLNYNKQPVNHPVIQDFYSGGQHMVTGSLKVYELELTGSSDGVAVKNEVDNADGSVYTVDYSKVDDEGNKGFELTFNDEIASAYQIEYRTSLADQIITDKYDNTATLLDGNTELSELPASVSVNHGKEYVFKEGVQKGKAVHWKIDINRGQSKVSNAQITDTLTPNQILVENSFKLYEGEVETNGDVRKGSQLLTKGTDYDLVITTGTDGGQRFALTFRHTIDIPYVLEYQSFINAANGAELSNAVIFTGDHIQEGTKDSTQTITVRFSAGSGSATGETGNLEITKVDAADHARVLQGAVFTLYDSTGTIAIRTATTGVDGKVVFANLIYDNYILKEDSAPEGYVVGIQDRQTVKLDAPVSSFMIQNKKIIRDVELYKVGEDNRNAGLSGAVFKLQFNAQDGNGYQDVAGKTSLTSGSDGKILVQDLNPGAYQFVEVTAPQDYVVNTSPISFTIQEKQTEVLRLDAIVNELKTGDVELTKRDQDNASVTLPGARFNLLNAAMNQTLRSNLTTDANGKLLVEGLKPGTYYLVETQAPNGYLVNSTPIQVVIDRGQTAPKQVTFTNALIRNALELTKVDEFDNVPLAGAQFILQDMDGHRVTTDQKGNSLPASFTTNNNGKFLINDLPPGDYQLVESQAPEHYEQLATAIPFTITAGTGVIARVTAENKLIPGSVELIKADFYNGAIKLPDAEFELQYEDGSSVPGVSSVLRTDTNGEIRVDNLRPGNYQFVERTAPEHYSLDSTPRQFTIVKSQISTYELTVKNKLKEGSFELTKEDAAYADIKLAGAVFELQDAGGNVVRSGLTTGNDGKLTINNLQPGSYNLIETQAPFGYKLDSTPISFEIVKSQTAAVKRTISNVIQPGDVELIKVDDRDNAIKLRDAKFTLERKDRATGTWVQQQADLVTDADGKITVLQLRPGDYRFVETEAPQYYKQLQQPVEFKIDLGQQQIKSVKIENTLIPGKLEITKEDSVDSARKLAGAVFKIVDSQNRDVQTNLVTGADGIVVSGNLQPGSYSLIETAPPSGYAPNSAPTAFTIAKGTTEIVRTQLTIQNEWSNGAVELTKVDQDNVSRVLAGAVFSLLDGAGNVLRTGLATDADGKLQATGLKAGNYQLVETTAPFGYKANADPVSFTITRFNTTAESVQKSNEVLRGAVKLVKVEAGNTTEKLEGAVFKLLTEQGDLLEEDLATDENGELTVTDLKPGKYKLVETEAPIGYELDATPVAFEIVLGQTAAVSVQKENVLTPGSVELTKVDADDNSIVLSGAVFELRDAGGTLLQSNLSTGADGKLTVDDLPPGNYSFVETTAPTDYVLSGAAIPFTIVKNQQAIAEVTAENELINGAVEITKVDAQDNTVTLADAEFKLLSASGALLQTGLTTNSNGKLVINNLKPGTYQLVETEAPADYTLDESPVSFTIVRNQQVAVQVQVENELIRGSVALTKKDADNASVTLQGAEFELQNAAGQTLESGLVTDEDGKLTVSNLLPGDYRFVETKAPFGYKLDTTPRQFTIVKSQEETFELVVTNEAVPGSVALTKVDAENSSLKLEGAEFELQDALGNVLEASLTTNEDGEIIVNDLKPGFYQFVEKQAPRYYVLDAAPISFEIILGQDERLEIEAINHLITGSVKLTKVEKDHDTITLEGAEFKLLAADDALIQEHLTTDENGVIEVANLKPGTYRFVETKAPVDYVLNETPIEFTIERNETAGTVVAVQAENELIRGAVELIKTDADAQGQVIEGAVFELQNAQGQVILSNLTTNSDGKITVGNLLPGSYQFVETAAAQGYRLDDTPIAFTIVRGQTQIAKVTKQNERLTGAVELTKIDSVDHEVTLSGATFNLLDRNDQVLRTGLVTDSEGKLYISGLKPGDYSLVETAAPEHYSRSDQRLEFTIVFNPQNTVELTMENTLIKGSVELTKVDSEDAARVLQGAEFKLLDAQGALLQEELSTNTDGILLIYGLAPGNYELIETKAPEHYQLNAAPISFEIVRSQQETLKLVFANTLTPGAVQLIKVDADQLDRVLEGAEFTLADSQGNELKAGLKTDEDGAILVENLKPGSYRFIETKAPLGYQLATAPIPFVIVEGQQETLQLQATNEQTPGSVELTKVDANNHERKLQGAEFSLKDKNGNTIQIGLATDQDGKLLVSGLKPGDYQFVETKAPAGYILDRTPIEFTISFNPTNTLEITVTNKFRPYYPSGPNPPDPNTPVNPNPDENSEHGQKPDSGKPDNEIPGQGPGNKPEHPGESGDGDTTPGSPEHPDRGEPGKPGNGTGHPSDKPGETGGKGGSKNPGNSEAGDSGKNPNGSEKSGNGTNGKDSNHGGKGGSEHSGAGTNGSVLPSGNGGELPRTGEEASHMNLILGLLSITAGAWLLLNKRIRFKKAKLDK